MVLKFKLLFLFVLVLVVGVLEVLDLRDLVLDTLAQYVLVIVDA